MLPGRAARDPDDRPARVLVPVRRAKPDKRRDKINSAIIFHAHRKAFGLGSRADYLQSIAQPLNRRACYENTAFKRILYRFVAYLPCDGRKQIAFGPDKLMACVEQHEASRPISVFRHAGPGADLAEERSLLVACVACDGNRAAKKLRISLADQRA